MTDTTECIGVNGRYKDYQYFTTNRGFGSRADFTILKRKSCRGCPKCGHIWEHYKEHVYEQWIEVDPAIKDNDLINFDIEYDLDHEGEVNSSTLVITKLST